MNFAQMLDESELRAIHLDAFKDGEQVVLHPGAWGRGSGGEIKGGQVE